MAGIIGPNELPWLIDVNVFMTPIAQTDWPTSTNQVDTSSIRNGWSRSLGTQNAERSYDVTLAAGTWSIEILHVKSDALGIISVQLDSVEVGTVDEYDGATVFNQRSTITGVVVGWTGKKRLTLKMTDKNPSSSSYSGYIQHIQLRRTA